MIFRKEDYEDPDRNNNLNMFGKQITIKRNRIIYRGFGRDVDDCGLVLTDIYYTKFKRKGYFYYSKQALELLHRTISKKRKVKNE